MGRASILMVLGLSFAMAVFGPSAARYSRNSYTNAVGYFSRTNVHNIALSGANVGSNAVFFDRTWTAGYSNIAFSQGLYSVTVSRLPLPDTARIKITSIGKFYGWDPQKRVMDTLRDTVWCILGPSSFAKFAVYLKNMTSASWATGDTVFGPMHIDGTLKYSGNPVFYGKVTVLTGKSGSGSPKFLGGYQSGVSLPLPTDISKTTNAATSGGKVFNPPTGSGQHKVRITFNGDSTINYSQWRGTVRADTQTNIKFRTLAPNMVLWVNQGCIEVKGTYKGQLTLAAGPLSSGTRNGDIFIIDDLVAATSPRTSHGSQDLLGLVADSSVIFPLPWNYKSSAPNAPHDCFVDAAMFCRNGTFKADLESHMGAQGFINVCGSLTSANISAFGVFSGGVLSYGYGNIFGYDDRFYTSAPPFYPNTGSYEAISWYE